MRQPVRFRLDEGELYHDHPVVRFDVGDCPVMLIKPHARLVGRPWIWRTQFHDAWPAVDIELLRRGFFYVFAELGNTFGCPSAIETMNDVYEHVVEHFSLNPRVVLEGFSRGGLFAYRWAAKRPSKIVTIYADAPVCDFKSWPGGKGRGTGSPDDWHLLQKLYGFSDEQQALAFAENPIDLLANLKKYDVPLLHVCGDADDVVPMEENTLELVRRYRQMGGRVEIITKPGVGHHPHSLEDPAPIVDFICRATAERLR